MVLAESLVFTDIGVRPRTWSCSGEVNGRPRGTSSDGLLSPPVDGRLGSGEGSLLTDIAFESLLRSTDGLANKESAVGGGPSKRREDELVGRDGGEGGAAGLFA